jgi:hypothetical protein
MLSSIYKFLPDAKIQWKDVWIGAFLTSVLFVIAKFLLGLYFGHSNPGSTYGAAGSIILILVWVNYAGLILLFGAEFTKVYADTYGTKVRPTEGAVSTSGADDNGAIVNKKPSKTTRAKRETPVGKDERIRAMHETVRSKAPDEETQKRQTEQTKQAAVDAFTKAAGAVVAPFVYAKREKNRKKKK